MTDHPQQTRRAILRLMYAADIGDDSPHRVLDDGRDTVEELHGPLDWELIDERLGELFAKRDDLDDQIRQLSPNWRVDRMAAVDRNLLRLGIYEILEDITPALIAINACVELAKEFGTASTPGFINGLLDQLCQDHDIPIETTDDVAD